MSLTDDFLWEFNQDISTLSIPTHFTFPFFYDPDPLAIVAANQLKEYLLTLPFSYHFGLDPKKQNEVGKMFGVLVVRKAKKIGFLCAFSGKIGDKSHYSKFVPPVFDVHLSEGFYKKGETLLNAFNATIEAASNDEEYIKLKRELQQLCVQQDAELDKLKQEFKLGKAKRDALRQITQDEKELKHLNQQSARQSIFLKKTKQQFNKQKSDLNLKISRYEAEIIQLKTKRKSLSSQLQKQIFEKYFFLNAKKEQKSLGEIFSKTVLKVPPAGAGECAAPKLLHFAYENDYEPICMAEFWWGKPPQSELRIHQNYYPACKGKCEPILGFMLEGLKVEQNPFLALTDAPQIKILFEDDDLIIFEKPHELLSVPGNTGADSAQHQLERKYHEFPELKLVHRLDMSTSGIMIATKNQRAFKYIQRQFIQKTIQKRYVARLSGLLQQPEGVINLPLKSDFLERPRQYVCFESGKSAITHYETITAISGEAIVYFYPKTGRTHQLRVHAAHQNGLSKPIKGDDIYGNKNVRLFLHAERIIFTHPTTKEIVSFEAPVPQYFFQ